MKLVKFFLALVAGFSIIKLFKFMAEVELNEEEVETYEDEYEYPLFV